ncbi:thiamine phosphate synthase [Mesonia mobilis]|uniref:Thiamine-phosphate synthase n=1 Tax=Mesonia mobilis TaxID=369791 RepID=A0ABQ3BP56_9FLAO|nr:thiamine phosphate synthase [Mesonia mobilis]MBQ0737215.1 thiamine phosphate synthase [Aquimarina celericrescens]GGZ49186.1 thiamine-phosphate synthase [Mesonia mobilis]
MVNSFPYKLYLVISEEACKHDHFLTVAEQAVKGGVDLVQLREKNASTAIFQQKAFQLKEILDRYQVPLIINDNLAVARQVEAFGIHVGTSDVPPTQIRERWENVQCLGYSIEDLQQLESLETKTADYLGVSPVFKTDTKTDTIIEWGLSGIEKIRSLSQKPLVAIGNMKIENANEVIKAGADCIAVVSAICAAQNPAKAAEQLRNKIEK